MLHRWKFNDDGVATDVLDNEGLTEVDRRLEVLKEAADALHQRIVSDSDRGE